MARITIDGKTYDADEDTLAQMAKDGVKYETPKASAGGGFWQGAGDLMRGGAHGVSLGLADAKFGQDNQSLLQRAGLDDYSKVKERSPVLTNVGDLGGSLVNPLGELGVAAKGAGMAARIGRGMLGAGVESLVRETADQGQQGSPLKALEAGGIGAAIGGVLPGLGAAVNGIGNTKGVKAAGEWLGDAVDKGADSARNLAFGIGKKELDNLARKTGASGDTLAADTAAHLEQLAPSPKWGSNAASKGEELATQRRAAGADIGSALDTAGASEGLNTQVPGAWRQLQQKLGDKALELPNSAPQENALSNMALGAATRTEKEAAPETLGGLHKRVSDWGKQAYKADNANKTVTTLENDASSQTANMMRDTGREELQNVVNQASPATQTKFNEGMSKFSDIVDYERAAKAQGTREASRSNVMGMVAAPALATIGGGVNGLITGGIPGALAGAALGGGMAIGSGTRNAFRQMAETSRGFDVAANAGRAVAGKLKNADSLVQGLGEALARQGNKQGAVAVEGMLAPAFVPDMEDEERQRREALGYGSR